MKVYFDNTTLNVVIEGVGRYMANGSLIASVDGDNVYISYKDIGSKELYMHYSEYKTQSNVPYGSDASSVATALNLEFDKTIIKGQSSFTGTQDTKVVSNSRIKSTDLPQVTAVSNTTNETLTVSSVIDGSFTVKRNSINALLGLTSGLTFNYIVP